MSLFKTTKPFGAWALPVPAGGVAALSQTP